MKFNVASPTCGTQKKFECDDEKRLVQLYELRVAQEFDGAILDDAFKGYTLKITGGNDKQGFGMKQGVLTNSRVKLLLNKGDKGVAGWRMRDGERRRKSVRGCIVGSDIAVLNCIIVREGEEKIEGLTDHTVPRRLGPKRASKIRRLFNLGKDDDVRKFVIRRQLPERDGKKARSKAPKIQRLVTPITLQRRRRKKCLLRDSRAKSKEEREAYQTMLDRRRVLRRQRLQGTKARGLAGKRSKEIGEVARESARAAVAAKVAAAAAKKSSTKPAAKKAPKKK